MSSSNRHHPLSSHSNTAPSKNNPSSGIPYGYVPSYLAGSASLVEQLDQRLLIVLRDGRHLVGTLRSFDQFSNMILEDCSERRMCVVDGISHYASIPLGLYVVRGDSMVLLGQISNEEEEEEASSSSARQVSLEELEALQKAQQGEGQLEWDFDADLVA